jgi:hypothetical protein
VDGSVEKNEVKMVGVVEVDRGAKER